MMPLQINKKILIYLFIFFILTTITNTKLSYDFYKIKKFNIIGLDENEISKLYGDFEIFKDKNIFLFDQKNISEAIESFKTVEAFKIKKIYPSTLNIEIKKTKFLALVKINGIDYLIGANGNLIEDQNEILELPFVFGNINVDNFLNFKKIIDKSKFEYDTIKKLYYFKSNRWDIVFKDELVIKVPNNLTAEKLNLIFDIVNKKNFKNIKSFDFRQKNMLIINE